MQSKLFLTLGSAAILGLASSAHGGIVNIDRDWGVAPDVQGGVNLGGLDENGNLQIANGDDKLRLSVGFTDTGDTGAEFTAVLTLTGLTNGDAAAVPPVLPAAEVSTNPAGRVVFVDGQSDRMESLTLSVSEITLVSGPIGTVATFDGFTTFTLDQFAASNDSFMAGGVSYIGDVDGAGGSGLQTVSFDSIITNGSSLVDNNEGGQYRFQGLGLQFNVAVPEPASMMLVAGGLGCMLLRRR